MPIIPERLSIEGTQLWQRIADRRDYVFCLTKIHKLAQTLGGKVEHQLPALTDHSIRHMDALWGITEVVLTQDEIAQLTPAEAFALAMSFYIHDIGLCVTCTEDGTQQIRNTEAYQAQHNLLQRSEPGSPQRNDIEAIIVAVRETHAYTASSILKNGFPGLDEDLIVDPHLKEVWTTAIAAISESHSWSLDRLDDELGRKGKIPSPDGRGEIDLGYVACLLRIIDFAHINRDRAPILDLRLRPKMPSTSRIHWLAQNSISGPVRDFGQLSYSSVAGIETLDAWWLFYDMCKALDSEIRSVSSYLRSRTVSAGRFSLYGVRGIESPESFSHLVELEGDVQPLDVQVQPHSMDRVIELLGGKALYGDDLIAPLRELIQNSRDAIELRRDRDIKQGLPTVQGLIKIEILQEGPDEYLVVSDNGGGMPRNIVTKHLISVASDFWNSPEFAREYGPTTSLGFKHIGRFGIGFLSVFMFGDEVEVETEARSNKRLTLHLRGLDKRGELKETPGTGVIGTSVRIKLKDEARKTLRNLPEICSARAPMIEASMEVKAIAATTPTIIKPGWWQGASREELDNFLRGWHSIAFEGSYNLRSSAGYPWSRDTDTGAPQFTIPIWPGDEPELLTDWCRVICASESLGLGVLICSFGIAVSFIPDNAMTGIVEVGSIELPASRNLNVNSDPYDIYRRHRGHMEHIKLPDQWNLRMLPELRLRIIAKLNSLAQYGMLPARLQLVRYLATRFGSELLSSTTLTWISVTEPPGNSIYMSAAQLVRRVGELDRLMVGIGVSAGGAYSVASEKIGEQEASSTFIISSAIDEFRVDYSVEKVLSENHGHEIDGPLGIVLQQANINEASLVFCLTYLRLVAKAWNVNLDTLKEDVQWHLAFKRNVLWAYIRRPEVSPDESVQF